MPLLNFPRFRGIATLACLSVSIAFGDQVVLKNGDRVTGTIVKKDATEGESYLQACSKLSSRVCRDLPRSGRLSAFLAEVPSCSRLCTIGSGRFSVNKAKPITLLVVDDEPLIRDLVKRMLTDAGFIVLVADSAEDALLVSRGYAGAIDVVLTDVRMPGMGGPELCCRLRTERPGILCLLMTGFADIATEGFPVLHKPFRSDQLVSHVRDVYSASSALPPDDGTRGRALPSND